MRDLYHSKPIRFGALCSSVVVFMFTLLIYEYEHLNMSFQNIADSLWYVLITCTTIGFGEISAVSKFGQLSMVIATFMGIVFSSIFVVCTEQFLRLNNNELLAIQLLNRSLVKKKMKNEVVGVIQCFHRIKIIKREKYYYRDRYHKAKELFQLEKLKADYLYRFCIFHYQYINLLGSDYKRSTFFYQMVEQTRSVAALKKQRKAMQQQIKEMIQEVTLFQTNYKFILELVDEVITVDNEILEEKEIIRGFKMSTPRYLRLNKIKRRRRINNYRVSKLWGISVALQKVLTTHIQESFK